MQNSILKEADNILAGDRREAYGEAKESFALIAKLWSAHKNITITSEDVAMMMVMLKIVRSKGKFNKDNYVDICGYGALAAGLAEDPFCEAEEDQNK